jgi:hypothetical protein
MARNLGPSPTSTPVASPMARQAPWTQAKREDSVVHPEPEEDRQGKQESRTVPTIRISATPASAEHRRIRSS